MQSYRKCHKDPPTFEELWRSNRATFSIWALYLTQNRDEAERVLSNTCVAALRGFDLFRHEAAFETWVFKIMRNEAMNFFKHKRLVDSRETIGLGKEMEDDQKGGDWLGLGTAEDRSWVMRDPRLWANPEKTLLLLIFLWQVMDFIAGLPAEERLPFELSVYDDLECGAIARELGMNANTVRTRIHRTRLLLRKKFPHYPDYLH